MSTKRPTVTIYIEELESELDKLHNKLNDPELYIWTYFDEFKRSIDIAFTNKELQETDDQVKEIINNNWFEMIDRITAYENECKKNQIRNISLIKQETTNQIETINKSLNDLKSYEKVTKNIIVNKVIKRLYEEIIELMDDVLFAIGKILFLNKTMIFLDRSEYTKIEADSRTTTNQLDLMNDEFLFFGRRQFKELKKFSQMDTNKTIGKLLIINNVYFGQKIGINFFAKLNESKNQRLTNNLLKLNELQEQELNSNQIQEIDLNVTKINLSERNLKKIDYSLYSEFKNLTQLNLCHNQLQIFEANLIAGFTSLTIVNLSYNQIKHVEKDAFKGLINLQEINLKRNLLKDIDKFIFKDLTNLNTIYLNGNQFECDKLELYIEKSVQFISFKKRDCIYDIIFGGFFFRYETQNDIDSIIKLGQNEPKRKRIKIN